MTMRAASDETVTVTVVQITKRERDDLRRFNKAMRELLKRVKELPSHTMTEQLVGAVNSAAYEAAVLLSDQQIAGFE